MITLKRLFDKLGVYYEVVNSNEIRVVCPIDSNENSRTMSMLDIINSKNTFCHSDEGVILIRQNTDGSLDWLGCTP